MERITRFRASVLILILTFILGFYGLRLFQAQIIETEGDTYNVTTFTTMTRVKAARGDILDRNGNTLVGNRASYDMIINHFVLTSSDDPNGSLYRLIKLCEEMGIEYIDNFPVTMERPFAYTLEEQDDAWKGYFQTYLTEQGNLDSDITAPLLIKQLREDYDIPEEWTDEEARKVIGIRYELRLRGLVMSLPTYVFLEDATDEQLSAILECNVPGMNVEASTVREYYTDYAAHVIGVVGEMSPAQWEYYSELGYSMDAEVGQNGIEKEFEEYLHGTDGWRIDVVTADGTIVESYYEDGQAPVAGKNVELTIDIALQQVMEEALADGMKTLAGQVPTADGADCEGAAAVAMDPKTGEVLAMCSYPTYTLNDYFENFNEINAREDNPLFNRATDAVYPPGSTYKMSMIVAAIDSKTVNSATIIRDTGTFEVGGMTLYCSSFSNGGFTDGDVYAAKGLTVSCNVYFYTLASMMNIETMDAAAKALGLGEPTGIEIEEAIGHRSNPEVKAANYNDDDAIWYEGDKVQTGIGQGENMFSPLQLCVYTSTVANKGTRMKATLLKRVVSTDYTELVVENTPKVANKLDISDEAYNAILQGMNGVVNDPEGTAWSSFNVEPDLITPDVCPYVDVICAKTGTAEHGTSSVNSDHGSFVAFAPMNDPQIAVAMYGEKVGHGYSMARATREVLEYFLSADEAADVEIYENRPG